MKVLFFLVFPEINAGSRYRVYKYLSYLEKENIEYAVCPPMSNGLFQYLYQTKNPIKKALFYLITYLVRVRDLAKVKSYDLIFIHQGLCYFGPPVLEYFIARLNKNIILDIDDAHFAKPLFATGFGARFHDRNRIAKLCKLSSQVIVSVDYIKQYVEKHNTNVVVIPTSVDLARYVLKDYKRESNRSLVIGWAGTASGLVYLRNLEKVLEQLSQRYDFHLKIICTDTIPLRNVKVTHCQWSLENEIRDLQSLDIGIMPLPDSEFEKGKGGFKLIQYMGVGVPVVCSPVGVNSEIVQDGINGFLAETENEWLEKLSLLLENEEIREKVGKKGRESIQDKFTIEGNAAKFVQVIKNSVH
ncbi:MAG: glycosyltransferase family 4 protein [bacterium]